MRDGAPHVPTGDGAVGAPAFAVGGDFARLGNGFLAVEKSETFLHGVIVDGQNVRAAEPEDEKHFDGPGADAADGNQPLDQLLIGHIARHFQRRNHAINRFLREIFHGHGFCAREARFAQSGDAGAQDFFGSGANTVRAERFDARENRAGGLAGDALVGDGLEQRFVNAPAFVELEREFADVGDQAAEALVRLGQVLVRFEVIERERETAGCGVHGRETG